MGGASWRRLAKPLAPVALYRRGICKIGRGITQRTKLCDCSTLDSDGANRVCKRGVEAVISQKGFRSHGAHLRGLWHGVVPNTNRRFGSGDNTRSSNHSHQRLPCLCRFSQVIVFVKTDSRLLLSRRPSSWHNHMPSGYVCCFILVLITVAAKAHADLILNIKKVNIWK